METKQKIKVFFVDDDPLYLRMLENNLKKNPQYENTVSSFSSGDECIKNIHHKPDIIVLDYYLNSVQPDAINGIEVLKKIKKSLPETHVIMLSGQDKIDVAINTMKYGAFDYVVKNESAFIRTRNAMNNIVNGIRLKEETKKYKLLTTTIIALMATITMVAIVLNFVFPGIYNIH